MVNLLAIYSTSFTK